MQKSLYPNNFAIAYLFHRSLKIRMVIFAKTFISSGCVNLSFAKLIFVEVLPRKSIKIPVPTWTSFESRS